MSAGKWAKFRDGYYEVSESGLVRRARDRKPISQRVLGAGYPTVSLRGNGEQTTAYVHRMVAEVFIGVCPEGKEVNHKDGDKMNSSASNLEYLTHSENRIHSMSVLGVRSPQGSESGHAKLTESDIPAIRDLRQRGVPIAQVAEAFGVVKSVISGIANRRTWRHVT